MDKEMLKHFSKRDEEENQSYLEPYSSLSCWFFKTLQKGPSCWSSWGTPCQLSTLVVWSGQQIVSWCYLKTPTLIERATSGLRGLMFCFSSVKIWSCKRSAFRLVGRRKIKMLTISVEHEQWQQLKPELEPCLHLVVRTTLLTHTYNLCRDSAAKELIFHLQRQGQTLHCVARGKKPWSSVWEHMALKARSLNYPNTSFQTTGFVLWEHTVSIIPKIYPSIRLGWKAAKKQFAYLLTKNKCNYSIPFLLF